MTREPISHVVQRRVRARAAAYVRRIHPYLWRQWVDEEYAHVDGRGPRPERIPAGRPPRVLP